MTFDNDVSYIVYYKEHGNFFKVGFDTEIQANEFAATISGLIGIYLLKKL